jgi:hypothetical protein
MCFYYNNGSLIYCDYDTGLGDTLTNVGLEYTFSQSASVYTIRFDFYRSYTSSIILSPQPYTASDFSDIRFNGSMSVNLISLYTIPQFTAFASASTSFPLPCVYDVTGSYVVRTYGNNNGEPDYAIFQDNTIIVNELGLTENQVENIKNNQLIGDTLQTSTKYIIVLVTLIFIIGAFVTIGFSIGQVQGSFIVGVLLSIFALVMFTVFGWIPAWILVFLIICAGATLILVSKLPSGGSAG